MVKILKTNILLHELKSGDPEVMDQKSEPCREKRELQDQKRSKSKVGSMDMRISKTGLTSRKEVDRKDLQPQHNT